jgi:hypothetical protein
VAPAVANDFLNQGMNCVTVAHGYMGDEFATTLAPAMASRQTTVEDTITSVVDDLLEGQYNDPLRVIGFNTTERHLRDVSEDVARELRQRCVDQDRRLPDFLHDFIARYQTVKT